MEEMAGKEIILLKNLTIAPHCSPAALLQTERKTELGLVRGRNYVRW